MTKKLIIAEKPSVARDIASAIRAKKNGEHYENDQYVISSAVGHLLEMVPPKGVEVVRGKWSLVNLPVLPDKFELQPIKKTETRLKALQKLCKRKDIDALINACDAGREGELIFRNIAEYLKKEMATKEAVNKVANKRLWLQSMTPAAIRQGFENLRDESELEPLKQAAMSRAAADWLVGINATRAITALNSSHGGFSLTTVGRVQTPTLALIVERNDAIKNFIKEDFWEIKAVFAVEAGEYEGVWHDETKKEKGERIFSLSATQEILKSCENKEAVLAQEKTTPASESSPALFNLISLQREANQRFGLSAKGTLAAAQSLYERHKMITYPRTDSRVLPEDYFATVKKRMQTFAEQDSAIAPFAQKILQNNWIVKANKRIFNNAKVSDHFAIIPTGEIKNLTGVEEKIYNVILLRFLSVFYPAAKYLVTERKTKIGDNVFITKGRVLTEIGWREVLSQTNKNIEIAPVKPDEKINIVSVTDEQKQTQPPAYFTEASLLSAMESAGKKVEDENLREAMKDRGIGTPATRSTIIEGLIKERYIYREGKNLLSAPKAHSLIRLLYALKIEGLTQAELTGEWENKLMKVENNQLDSDSFIREIKQFTQNIVASAKQCPDIEKVEGNYATIKAPCPQCQGQVKESHRRFSCTQCDFFIWKAIAFREFTVEEAEIILSGETTEELEGFRSRLGRDFSARVRLEKNDKGLWGTAFVFEQNPTEASLSDEEINSAVTVGPCPKCGADVRRMGRQYPCIRSLNKTEDNPAACDFVLRSPILKQEIDEKQATLLLKEGKTELLTGFVSNRTKRPFKAYLAMDLSAKSGEIRFEFEASKSPKSPKSPKSAKPSYKSKK